ncbi:hypothetical protein D3C81_1439700 [compost metagenome]
MQSTPSDGHPRRSANTVHSATLTAAMLNNKVACSGNGAKFNTSMTQASAHQPAPHTSNTWDNRNRLSPLNRSSEWPICKRQAPTIAASPSSSGAQNPPWVMGCRASLNCGPAARNSAPPNSCTASALNTNVRDCRCTPANSVSIPAKAQLITVPWLKKNSGASK